VLSSVVSVASLSLEDSASVSCVSSVVSSVVSALSVDWLSSVDVSSVASSVVASSVVASVDSSELSSVVASSVVVASWPVPSCESVVLLWQPVNATAVTRNKAVSKIAAHFFKVCPSLRENHVTLANAWYIIVRKYEQNMNKL